MACWKLNKTECQSVAETTFLGPFEETKDHGIHTDSFSLIICFYVIVKLVIKMLFLQQLFLSLGQFILIYVEKGEYIPKFCLFTILQPLNNNLSSKLGHPLELILRDNFVQDNVE